MEDLTGKQFSGYHIVAPLGEGGMAAVYKAYQPGIDRYVALKILPRYLARDPQFIARFEQEAKVLAKLQHPHILPIHDYGEADGFTYIVMPFIQSGDLNDLLREKRLSFAEIERIMTQVGDALDYAHSQGVVHRDVKPSNILVDQRGNCLLTDFGIAKIVEGSSNRLTVTGGVVGTPTYMSPEQGSGRELDGRSDIYALGVILYEMCTGRVPFRAETPMAVMIKHINDPLLPPREINSNLSPALERVILKALAKQPDDRFATAGDMVRALQTAIQMTPAGGEGLTELSPLPTTGSGADLERQTRGATKAMPPPDRPGMKELWLVLGVALVIIIVGLIGLAGWWLAGKSGPDQGSAPPPPPAMTPALPAAQPLPTQPPAQPPAQPLPTQPPAQPAAQPLPTQPPAEPPAGQPPLPPQPGQGPPQEAIQACAGASEGATCTFNTPHGQETGVCWRLPVDLACLPPDAPRPPGE